MGGKDPHSVGLDGHKRGKAKVSNEITVCKEIGYPSIGDASGPTALNQAKTAEW